MLGGVALHQVHVVLAVIVGAFAHLAFQSFHAFFQLGSVGKSFLCLVADGGRVLQVHHLWQVAYGGVLGNAHRACRCPLQAAQYLQHGRFSRAVLAHQGYAVAAVYHKTSPGKQRLNTKFHLKIFYRNHV